MQDEATRRNAKEQTDADLHSVRRKTARLREERLAREAAEKQAEESRPKPLKVRARSRKK
jgi:hypothetical protein